MRQRPPECYLHFTNSPALLHNNEGKISAQGIGCAKVQNRTRTQTHQKKRFSPEHVLRQLTSSISVPNALAPAIVDSKAVFQNSVVRWASVVIVFRFLLIRSFAQALKYCIKVLYISIILIILLKTVCV